MHSARLRLSLTYAGMFVLLGTCVIFAIYLFARETTATVTMTAQPLGLSRMLVFPPLAELQRSADISRLLAISWVALAFTAVAAAVLGWFVAGRMLRPLRQMTASAREITAGNLSRRLALSGRDDEFKRLGDTFDELLGRLEAAFEAQRRFVANASHELRTPLTVERTLLQVALADPNASAATLRATCEELLTSGRDQERLLEALLTLATSERGLEQTAPLDLATLTRGVLAGAAPELERRSLQLEERLEPAPTTGDAALVERLIANLLENAIVHNVDGGVVQVRTWSDQGRATLSVTNSAPLVPAGEVDRLFEPFQRLQATRLAGAEAHHGLGLSIVRAIASAHGATITASPGPAGGLVVTVVFPPRA